MQPVYLELLTPKELVERSAQLNKLLHECRICPNECLADRISGETGDCHSSDEVFISSYGPHHGEEPPLRGTNGSGTIFFTNCNLACEYCQNFDISQLGQGDHVTNDELAGIMLSLQKRGCHNVNFVTPTHYSAQIVEALAKAIEKGFKLPLVYNCGGYESVETLKLLTGIIDIYMPDIKYASNKIASKYSNIEFYWEVVKDAVREMHRQVGDLVIDKNGIAQRGLLIRHLILPDNFSGSKDVLDFVANEISTDTYINLMDQYYPAYKAEDHHEINRRITQNEFDVVVDYAYKLGLKRGF